MTGDLFADRAAPVDIEAASRVLTVRCHRCREQAPRVFVGVGRDLHRCSCGAWVDRWHCCGHVALSPSPTSTYRADAVCPDPECGVYRFGSPETPNMIGTIDGAETVRCGGLNDGVEE